MASNRWSRPTNPPPPLFTGKKERDFVKQVNDEIIEGVVVAKVKGGLSVDIGVKAFLPGSQIDLRPVRNMDVYVGKKYKFKVIKFNKKRGNIVLSRRALLEEEREGVDDLRQEAVRNRERRTPGRCSDRAASGDPGGATHAPPDRPGCAHGSGHAARA